jgi:2-iminobutanoate/2-iminopropanoate deaminase
MATRIAGAMLGSCAALAGFATLAAERATAGGSVAGPTAVAGGAEPASIEFLDSGRVLPSGLPFSEAVRHGDTLYLSGQIGVRPGTLQLVPGGVEPETRQTMDSVRATLAAHGLSMGDVVKCTVMLADMAEWNAFNAIYRTYFTGRYPARSALGANGLALGARVEVECIAALPSAAAERRPAAPAAPPPAP